MKRIANLAKSTTRSQALKTHADVLKLQVVSHEEELLVQPGPGATKSVRTAFKAACEEGFSAVDPATTKGQHFVRIAARSMALQLKQKTGGGHQRNDRGGWEDIDIEAASSRRWKKWVASLSSGQKSELKCWRVGAVPSPARTARWMQHECPWCGHDYA